jgi:hypothetical protein
MDSNHSKYVALGLLASIMTIGSTVLAFPATYADSSEPPFIPSECEDYVGQESTDHFLSIDTSPPYLPGSSVDVTAGTTDEDTGTNRVRIVAILAGTNTIHDNVQLLPNPFGSVQDTINIPADANNGDSLDIYACFESPGSMQGNGVTHHLNVGSIFVLPESAIGPLALVGVSVAALGGYTFWGRKKVQL